MNASSSQEGAIDVARGRADDLVDRSTPVAGTHVAALDGIRGLAILLVLAFHFGRSARDAGFHNAILKASEFGWVGVDLFFVLSGFLITGILYDAKGSHHYFRNFYARRTLRIFPLYYLALVVVLILAAAWPSAGVWPQFSTWWFVFYLSNVATVTEAPLGPGILGHFWSLAIEEHFYLMWPAVVFAASRRQVMAIAAALLTLSLTLRVVLSAMGALPPEAFYFFSPLRMDALAVGAICSLAVRGQSGLAPLVRPALAAFAFGAALVLVLVAATRSVMYSSPLMYTIGFSSLAIMFGGLLIVVLSMRPLNAFCAHPVLRWFGRYSYGLYVWHPIVNVILFYTSLKALLGVEGPAENVLYLLFAFLLSIAISFISYKAWEAPFLAYKSRFH